MVEVSPRQPMSATGWGTTVHVDDVDIDWFIPGDQELEVVKGLLDRYLHPTLESLDRYAWFELKWLMLREV